MGFFWANVKANVEGAVANAKMSAYEEHLRDAYDDYEDDEEDEDEYCDEEDDDDELDVIPIALSVCVPAIPSTVNPFFL